MRRRVLGAVLALSILPACSRLITQGVVEELIELDRKGRLAKLAPDVQAAAERATKGVLGGTLDTLAEEKRAEQIRQAAAAFGDEVESIVRRSGNAIGEELQEHVVALTHSVLDRAERFDDDLPRTAAILTRDVLRTLAVELERGLDEHISPATERLLADHVGPGLADALGKDVGPALAGTLQNDLGPALGKVVRDDLRPALAETVDDASYHAALGFARALDEVLDPKREDSFGARLRELFENGKETLEGWLLVALLLAGAALSTFLALWIRSKQRERAEFERAEARERALLLVAEAIHEANRNDTFSMDAYRDAVKRIGNDDKRRRDFAELKKFITTQPKIELPSRKQTP